MDVAAITTASPSGKACPYMRHFQPAMVKTRQVTSSSARTNFLPHIRLVPGDSVPIRLSAKALRA